MTFVESAGCREAGLGACFQAQALETASPRGSDQMLEHLRGDALALEAAGGAHRLDLAVLTVEGLEGDTADQRLLLPGAPQDDVVAAQVIHRQRVVTLRR